MRCYPAHCSYFHAGMGTALAVRAQMCGTIQITGLCCTLATCPTLQQVEWGSYTALLQILACMAQPSYQSMQETDQQGLTPQMWAITRFATSTKMGSNLTCTERESCCGPDLPNVLHYGLLYGVEEAGWQFDKHWYQEFDALVCPPWAPPPEGENPTQGLFPFPPRPSTLTSKVKPSFCFSYCISRLLDIWTCSVCKL